MNWQYPGRRIYRSITVSQILTGKKCDYEEKEVRAIAITLKLARFWYLEHKIAETA